MDSQPQLPQETYKKDGQSSSQGRGMQDFDALEDRKIGNGSTLKFGSQMDMGTELRSEDEVFPRPSSSHADPLNWSRWRRELAFAAIMLTAATIGSLKMLFVTVNAVVAIGLGVSYTSAAALTGVPLIFGALSGLASQILSQMVGKRGIYLVSSVLMLLAAVWNMHVKSNYAEFMASRIFQGIGWGFFEALIADSITDLFFVPERAARTNAYNVINLVFTWGTPILGGYLSQSTESFRNQIMVINVIQAFAIAMLIGGYPETTFDRTTGSTPPAENPPSATGFKLYISTLKLKTEHSTHPFSAVHAIQPLKALYAPSTLFASLLSVPLAATAFGIAQSISLIFTSMPTFLFPSRLGFLFILPLIFSLLTFTISSTIIYLRTKPPHHLSTSNITLGLSIPSLILSVAGLLSLGIYVESELMPTIVSSSSGSVFALLSGPNISLKTVSALFGLLVSGSVSLSYTSITHLSTPYSSTKKSSLLKGGFSFWEETLKGVWTIGMPVWIQGADESMVMVMGLKDTGIALAVVGVLLGSSVGALFWCKGNEVRGLDGRVLGRVRGEGRKLRRWESGGSYLDV